MKISTTQAGDILGVTRTAVADMIKVGLLKDYATVKEGQKRHFAKLDAKEVRAFKKIYKPKRHYSTTKKIVEATNGELTRKDYDVLKEKARLHTAAKQQPSMADGVMTRLGNIETKLNLLVDKLDQLVRMWL